MYGRYSGNKRKSYGGRFSGYQRGYPRRRGQTNWLQPRAYRNLSSRYFGNPRADALINRSGSSVIPETYYTKLKFAVQLAWSSPLGVAVYAAIRNTIGDPTGALGSTRPMGAGSLDSLYTRWCVLGSRAKLTVIDDSGSGVGSSHCLIPHPNTANPFTAVDVVRAGTAAYAKQTLVNEQGSVTQSVISSYMSTAKMFGVSNSRVVDDPNFGGSATTDPSFYFIWIIGAQSADVSSNTGGIYRLEVTYYVKYWQRNIDPAT